MKQLVEETGLEIMAQPSSSLKKKKLFAGENQATGTTQTRIHRGKPG